MKYLKAFNTHDDYLTYIVGSEFKDLKYDSVSYCIQQNNVHFDKYVPETKLVCKYNVTSTSSATTLGVNFNQNIFNSMTVDDVQLNELVTSYTFNTIGIHTVKYELLDNTKFGNYGPIFQTSNLVEVTIPDTVIYINGGALNGCSGLTSINIPNSVTSIGASAFKDCSGLTNIKIPNNITSINHYAFYNCSNLTSIIIQAITPPTLSPYAFDKTNNCPIYVPAESVETYKATSGWSTYTDRIQAIQE